ncbi:MAG TPA: J domain-containing protein, partial [Kofleriaceae bacterium]|nr:J domain-containing protein [Kofleriaceae bacterium]
MAGFDEAQARTALTTMQERLTKGPFATLGIEQTATADDVRAAFLGLTKRYHPAKFARMSIELQRLSNEVFLGIRG